MPSPHNPHKVTNGRVHGAYVRTVVSTSTADHPSPPEWVPAKIADELLTALLAVVAVADRKTVEFDAARAAIAKARANG